MPSQRVSQALATWRQWKVPLTSPPKLLCPLLGGMTNRSWLIDTDAGRGVLRLDEVKPRRLGIDRGREALVTNALSEKPYVAPVWFQNPVSGIQVTGFVVGELFDSQTLPVKYHGQLQGIIRDYQGVTLPPIAPIDYYQYLQRYWQRCAVEGLVHDSWHNEWRQFLPRLKAFQDTPWTPVLCHHDLAGRNIILGDKGLTLIDWEYAHLGHPSFDLMALCGSADDGIDEKVRRELEELLFWLNRLWPVLRFPDRKAF